MSIGPIPRSKMLEYAQEFGLHDFETFRYFVNGMDVEWLSMVHSTTSKKDNEVPVEDTSGARRIFETIKTRSKAARKKQ